MRRKELLAQIRNLQDQIDDMKRWYDNLLLTTAISQRQHNERCHHENTR